MGNMAGFGIATSPDLGVFCSEQDESPELLFEMPKSSS